jgi:succinyl-diaminopimelate desuccinylase
MPLSPVALTQELVRFKTVNPPGDEQPCAEHLARLLEAAGFALELVPFGEHRAQLIARIGGSPDKLPLAFTGHLDTVPLGARPWTFDPFVGEIADGKLYGRGSSDMKSGVAAFVAAAAELAGRLRGTPGLMLVLTAGEETGCAGAFDLAGRKDLLGQAGALVVAEPTGNRPLVGHKGALWVQAETRGVTAHGSMPEKGVNAIHRAARAVAALERFEFDIPAHAVLGAPTLNVGTIAGGLNINSVPDRCVIGIDIRTIPSQDDVQIGRAVASVLGDDVALRTVLDVESVWTDPGVPWMAAAASTVREITGEAAPVATAPFFTDASALKPALGDPPTIILGPGELALAHQTDEYCRTGRIEEAAAIYTALIRDWCGV